MKLSEIKQDLEELVKEFIAKHPKLRIHSGERDLHHLCHSPGYCHDVSIRLERWLKDHKVDADILMGWGATNRKWPEAVGIPADDDQDAHTVVRVGDRTVDLTARQFDPQLPMPRYVTVAQFKKEWKTTAPETVFK